MIRTIVILAALGGLGYLAWGYVQQQQAADPTDPAAPGSEPDPTQPQPWGSYQVTGPQAVALALAQSQSEFAPAEIMALIQIESGFNPNAYRAEPAINDGSYGLMQILAGTAAQMGYAGASSGLFDPATNVAYGVAYLSYCRNLITQRFGSWDWMRLATAYNAGPGNALAGHLDTAYVSRFQAALATWQQALA